MTMTLQQMGDTSAISHHTLILWFFQPPLPQVFWNTWREWWSVEKKFEQFYEACIFSDANYVNCHVQKKIICINVTEKSTLAVEKVGDLEVNIFEVDNLWLRSLLGYGARALQAICMYCNSKWSTGKLKVKKKVEKVWQITLALWLRQWYNCWTQGMQNLGIALHPSPISNFIHFCDLYYPNYPRLSYLSHLF